LPKKLEVPLDTIICGDNCAVLRTFKQECIDLVVTSPPYDNLRTYEGHEWNFEEVAQQLWRVIKVGGVVVWIVNDATVKGSETGTSFRQVLRFMEIGFKLHDTMIYKKTTLTFPETNRYYPNFEFMFVLSKGRPKSVHLIADRKNKTAGEKVHSRERMPDGSLERMRGARKGSVTKDVGVRWNVWEYGTGLGHSAKESIAFKHPAIFPETLVADHIRSWSNEGDVVLDPFNGSGTTTKMARNLGRRYIGIDISEKYCAIARKRFPDCNKSFPQGMNNDVNG